MSEKIYKKLFIRNALKLYFKGLNFRFINFTATLFFSRSKKPSRLLIYTNRLLTRKICECALLHEKCEYFKSKMSEYAPV